MRQGQEYVPAQQPPFLQNMPWITGGAGVESRFLSMLNSVAVLVAHLMLPTTTRKPVVPRCRWVGILAFPDFDLQTGFKT